MKKRKYKALFRLPLFILVTSIAAVFLLLKPLIFSTRYYLPTGISIRIPNEWNKKMSEVSTENIRQYKYSMPNIPLIDFSNKENSHIKMGLMILDPYWFSSAEEFYNRSIPLKNQKPLVFYKLEKVVDDNKVYVLNRQQPQEDIDRRYAFDHSDYRYLFVATISRFDKDGKEYSGVELAYYKFLADQIVKTIKFE